MSEAAGREVELATKLFELEKLRKEHEERASEAKAQYALVAQDLKEFLLEEGKSSTGHIVGVGEFAIKREIYPSVSSARMPGFVSHLRAQGEGGLVKETVEPGTLKKYLKEKLDLLAEAILEARGEEDGRKSVWLLCLRTVGAQNRDVLIRALSREPDDLTETPAHDVATKVYGVLGVTSFLEFKLSHTKKGK